MNDTKKLFTGGLSYQGGIPLGEVAQSAAHLNLKCKILKIFTCYTLILTFHLFRFKLDETVTLTLNLTQLFYFQNIAFLFSANKIKHTTSNLKSLKRHKLGGDHLIFIFRREFPYEGNYGNVDTPLHSMNIKYEVLNTKMNLFLSLKSSMCKYKNKKKQVIQKFTPLKHHNQTMI